MYYVNATRAWDCSLLWDADNHAVMRASCTYLHGTGTRGLSSLISPSSRWTPRHKTKPSTCPPHGLKIATVPFSAVRCSPASVSIKCDLNAALTRKSQRSTVWETAVSHVHIQLACTCMDMHEWRTRGARKFIVPLKSSLAANPGNSG